MARIPITTATANWQDFSASDVILLAVDDATIFEKQKWQGLSGAIDQIEDLDDVRRVTSLLQGNLIETRGEALHIASYADEAGQAKVDWEQLRTWVIEDELMKGTLVSPDGNAYTLVVELTDQRDRPVEAHRS